MKKTLLAMLMAGSSIAVFAQTNPTTTPPTNPTTTPPTTTTTQPTTPTTTTPVTQSSTTVDPMSSTTNSQLSTNSVNFWTPTASPYWGWNSYGLWNTNAYPTTNSYPTTNAYSSINAYPTTNTTVSGSVSTNASMNNGSLNSSSDYSAYGGTSVNSLPSNVQNNFGKDYPTNMSNTYSWSQYGDWFHTQYMSSGRSTHYYYDTRGNGYSLALPVIQTYVPEEIIDKALQKYGSNLYSISAVKTQDGDAYAVGLIERGQLKTEYLKEDGSTIANIWRVEELTTTDANAAMESQNNTSTDATISNDATGTTTEAKDEKETKTKWKEDGIKTKIKSGDGKLKIKQKKVDD